MINWSFIKKACKKICLGFSSWHDFKLVISYVINTYKPSTFKKFKMVWLADAMSKPSKTTNGYPFVIIEKCILFAGSRFLIKNNELALNISGSRTEVQKLYNEYHLQEELLNIATYHDNPPEIGLRINTHAVRLPSMWVSTLHSSSDNWMHFISEIAPKLHFTINNFSHFSFNILFDSNISKSSIDVLQILAGKRKLFGLPKGHTAVAKKLLVPLQETTICTVSWPRDGAFGLGCFKFDHDSIFDLRKKILDHFSITPQPKNKTYISRKSYFRYISNKDEIEDFLIKEGYNITSPGDMTLLEQVTLFSQTAVLIAQAGAALANMMFMPQGATIICLCADSEWINYNYFQEYAEIFGLNFIYLKGLVVEADRYDPHQIASEFHPSNANFELPLNMLRSALRTLNAPISACEFA